MWENCAVRLVSASCAMIIYAQEASIWRNAIWSKAQCSVYIVALKSHGEGGISHHGSGETVADGFRRREEWSRHNSRPSMAFSAGLERAD